MTDIDNTRGAEVGERRGPGRPRNADRPPQHVASAPEREPARESAHVQPRTRTRMARNSVADDPFYIPVDEIPEGSSYEWKRHSVNGQEDPFYLAQMRRQGWEPVDPRMHPNWVPPDYSLPHIIKGGQILMERPMELTKEAIAERDAMARQQVNEAEERLGRTPKELSSKDAGASDHEKVRPKVVREMMRPVSVAIEE